MANEKHYPNQKQCCLSECKKWSAYMRRVNGKKENYCAEHWKQFVEKAQATKQKVKKTSGRKVIRKRH